MDGDVLSVINGNEYKSWPLLQYEKKRMLQKIVSVFLNLRFLARQENKVMVTPSLKLKCNESAF